MTWTTPAAAGRIGRAFKARVVGESDRAFLIARIYLVGASIVPSHYDLDDCSGATPRIAKRLQLSFLRERTRPRVNFFLEKRAQGSRDLVARGREICRYNFVFNRRWQGKIYPIKQVAPVIKDEGDEIIVITVYTFYF